MSLTVIIIIALALAIDAFSVALAAGSYFGKLTPRQKFRLSFHFGLFQFIMPIVGWLAGIKVVEIIQDYDHWIAFAILTLIGIKMIIEARKPDSEWVSKDITRGFSLVSLSVATSIDALAVGFSIGIIGGNIILPSIIIGIVAAVMTLIGMKSGERLSFRFGSRISIFGGIILICIGLKIVIDHLHLLGY